MAEKKKTDKGAVWSLLLGLLFWFPLLNFIFGAIAVYLGIESLKRVKVQKAGISKALAAAGVLLGTLPFYFGLLALARWMLKLDSVAVAGITIITAPVFLAVLLALLKIKRLI